MVNHSLRYETCRLYRIFLVCCELCNFFSKLWQQWNVETCEHTFVPGLPCIDRKCSWRTWLTDLQKQFLSHSLWKMIHYPWQQKKNWNSLANSAPGSVHLFCRPVSFSHHFRKHLQTFFRIFHVHSFCIHCSVKHVLTHKQIFNAIVVSRQLINKRRIHAPNYVSQPRKVFHSS